MSEPVSLPALTVWQPWASLIALGLKPYEFRGWAAPSGYHGRRIAIHAGARPIRKAEIRDLILRLRDDAEAWTTGLHREPALVLLDRVLTAPCLLPLSHVVATAILGKPVEAWTISGTFGRPPNDSDRDEQGTWAWPLTDIQPLEPPEPAKGAQGFWTWRWEMAA